MVLVCGPVLGYIHSYPWPFVTDKAKGWTSLGGSEFPWQGTFKVDERVGGTEL